MKSNLSRRAKKKCNDMWMLLTPENFWYHMDSVWISEMPLPEWFGSLRYALPPPACFNEVRYFLSENNRVGNFVCLFKTLAMTFYVIFVIELLQWAIRLNLIWLERKRNLLCIRCCCNIFKCSFQPSRRSWIDSFMLLSTETIYCLSFPFQFSLKILSTSSGEQAWG